MAAQGFSNPFTEKNNPFKDKEKQKIFNPFKDRSSSFPTEIFEGAIANKASAKKVKDYATANKIIDEQLNAFGQQAEYIRIISDKGQGRPIWAKNPNWNKPSGPPRPRPDHTITVNSVAPLPAWRSAPWVNDKPVGIFGYGPEQWKHLAPNQRVFAYIHHMIRFDKQSQIYLNTPLESPEVQSFITGVSVYIAATSAGQWIAQLSL